MLPLTPAEKKGNCGSWLAISNIDLFIASLTNAWKPTAPEKLEEVRGTSLNQDMLLPLLFLFLISF